MADIIMAYVGITHYIAEFVSCLTRRQVMIRENGAAC